MFVCRLEVFGIFLILTFIQELLGAADKRKDSTWLIQTACNRNPNLRICKDVKKDERNFDPGDFFPDDDDYDDESEDLDDEPTADLKKYVFDNTESSMATNNTEDSTIAKEPFDTNLSLSVEKGTGSAKKNLVDLPPLNNSGSQQQKNGRIVAKDESLNNETVLVAVSSFCINTREEFVKKCHGEVMSEDVEFCQKYPLACEVTRVVIPILTYCRRYYKHFAKFCGSPEKITKKVDDFCIAFARYCLPTDNDRSYVNHVQNLMKTSLKNNEFEKQIKLGIPKSELKRCEDVVDEARKVCNPFPQSDDRFNYFRCSQFFKSCRRFVDWI
uniref:CX9C domain-containing protein n=1 Tax=Syphacia muris TaxID=451379 RepID=A0A0N5ALQ5_9BILA